MDLIDSHAHLDDRAFSGDRAAVVARMFSQSVGAITIGSSLRSSREALRIAERHRGIWATVGVHPHDAKDVKAATLGELAKMAARPAVVGIGEIGLDYYRDLSPRDVQRRAFADQLALARSLDLPVCLHNRDSTDDLLAVLHDGGRTHRGVVHSFLGDRQLAATFLDLGLHLGVGGPVTFPKNSALREAVRSVPLDRLLVETDCPYLTPVPHRGRRNEPVYVRYVSEEISKIKGVPPDEVARQTAENTMRLFCLPIES